MIKLSDHLAIPTMGEALRERAQNIAARERRDKRARQLARMYEAAKISRADTNWTVTPTTANYEIRVSLRTLRARARQQSRDNSHFKKFLTLVKNNVVGPKGFQLQVRARLKDGSLNVKLNKSIEESFWDWTHRETCSASGKLSWIDAQKLFVSTLARDGEVLVQKIYPKNNKFGFALKFIDVSYLDETYNEIARNGNRIIMSVEVDDDDKPTAYYLTTPPSDYLYHDRRRKVRVRVPAEEIIHSFLHTEDESQVRGVTWFHAALADAQNLKGYRDGVITSARAAACTFATITPPDDGELAEENTDDEGNRLPIEIEVQPLSVHELPPGYTMNAFDPKQPTQNHAEFHKSMMMQVAIGLDVNYFSLAGDMEAVNFSSARVGLNEERDVWRGVQDFAADHFCREVFHAWLEAAFLVGALDVSARDLKEIRNPLFRGRSWSYIDPAKDVAANVQALENKLATYTDVLAEQGIDLIEHLETLKSEKELAAKYGVALEITPKGGGAKEDSEDKTGEKPQETDNPRAEG